MPKIEKPTDAVIRIIRACVCGSDLWWYRGIAKREAGSIVGHEAIEKVLELTNGVGVDAVQECVGAVSAIEQAGKIARPGAVIGRVGVPLYYFLWLRIKE